ncbi:MAG: hypothetical protein EAZ57_11205 [Cytophagales bacterium]|nr:MAG: hypothetical protein EAZ67_11865 [Cytophagales bacterium]TAF59441.1 MAG: hypothetical protein EAZ57_11205 [Cytophagales bacterium]
MKLPSFDPQSISQELQLRQLTKVPFLGVVLNIGIALSLAGILGLFWILTHTLQSSVKEALEIRLFLERDISETQKQNLYKRLCSAPFIAQDEIGRPSVRLISKQEAAQIMTARTGEDFVKFLGENPLPDTYYLRIRESYHQENRLKALVEELQTYEGVVEVFYESDFVREINTNLAKLASVLILLALIFFATTALLINNAVRLTIFAEKELIRTMQLVGATSYFIQKPYLLRALQHGLWGGLMAILCVYMFKILLSRWLEDLTLILPDASFWLLLGLLLVLGCIMCVGSTYMAVRRYVA